MKFLRFALPVLLIASFLSLNGCSTPGGTKHPDQRAAFLRSMKQSGVPSPVYQKMKNARVLAFADVLAMVRAGVPGSKIVAYLKATRAPYSYTSAQIQLLQHAGADSTLINYVGRAAGDFLIDAQNEVAQEQMVQSAKIDRSYWNNPYFMDPGFAGDVPFEFGWPGMGIW